MADPIKDGNETSLPK